MSREKLTVFKCLTALKHLSVLFTLAFSDLQTYIMITVVFNRSLKFDGIEKLDLPCILRLLYQIILLPSFEFEYKDTYIDILS